MQYTKTSDTALGIIKIIMMTIIIIIIRIVDGMQFGSAATHSDSDLGRVDLSLASHNIVGPQSDTRDTNVA